MGKKLNFSIEVDGVPLQGIKRGVIEQSLANHHYFEIICRLYDKVGILKEKSLQSIGKEINISFNGNTENGSIVNTFLGLVTHIRMNKSEVDEIVYSGYSKSVQLASGSHTQSFLQKNLEEIIKEVSNSHQIKIKTEIKFKKKIPYLVQYKESAYHFLSRLADLYGEWFFFDGKALYFGSPKDKEPKSLHFGSDLLSFSYGLNARPSDFRLISYDYATHKYPEVNAPSQKIPGLGELGKLAEGLSKEIFNFQPLSFSENLVEDKSLLDQFAHRRKAGNAANYIQLDGVSDNCQLQIGGLVKVGGRMADLKSLQFKDFTLDEFRVVGLVHHFSGQGDYRNNFQAIPSTLQIAPLNPNLQRPLCEMQFAEVVDNDDPEKLGRVVVSLGWQKTRGDKTPWIRVSQASAGGDHGTFVIPEKGDQVLLGFENDNPDKPFVIGSFYHGNSKPDKDAPVKGNERKMFKTISGNKISIFDKDGEEEIKIENGKNSITLSLKESGKISINSDGGDIELAARNIILSAEGKIENTAAKGFSISSSKEVKIVSETNLSLNGRNKAKISGNEMKAEGMSKCEFGAPSGLTKMNGLNISIEATAINDIKGAIIKLN